MGQFDVRGYAVRGVHPPWSQDQGARLDGALVARGGFLWTAMIEKDRPIFEQERARPRWRFRTKLRRGVAPQVEAPGLPHMGCSLDVWTTRSGRRFEVPSLRKPDLCLTAWVPRSQVLTGPARSFTTGRTEAGLERAEEEARYNRFQPIRLKEWAKLEWIKTSKLFS